MTEAEQIATVKRILALPKTIDPFTILGIDIAKLTTVKSRGEVAGETEEGVGATSSSNAATDDAEEISHTTVKKAYRRISLLLHPDKCSVPRGTDAFSVVDRAYKMLPDEPSVERFKVQLRRKAEREEQARQRQVEAERQARQSKANGTPINSLAGLSVAQRKQIVLEAADEQRREANARKADDIQRRQAALRQKTERDTAISDSISSQQQQWADLGL